MNTQLTDKQIHFYRENGFLVINDFLADTELASWREAVDEAVIHHLSREDTHHNQRGEGSYYKYVFVQCVNLWKTSEQIKSLVLDSRLGKLATDLAGTSGVRLYHDHAMVKLPWANPTNFHVDNPYDPFYSRQAIMFWIALDDAMVQNGCLYFLPGTHNTICRFKCTYFWNQPGVSRAFLWFMKVATPRVNQLSPSKLKTRWTFSQKG